MQCQPYPGDGMPIDPTYRGNEPQFVIKTQNCEMYSIYDQVQGFDVHICIACLRWSTFSVGKWFSEVCAMPDPLKSPCPTQPVVCCLGEPQMPLLEII